MMDENCFEEQLRNALRRVDPPAGLERRILERAGALRRRVWIRLLSLAATVLVVLSAVFYTVHLKREQQRIQQAEQVRRQLEVAVQMTSAHLAKIERRLNEIGARRIQLREVSE